MKSNFSKKAAAVALAVALAAGVAGSVSTVTDDGAKANSVKRVQARANSV